MVMIKMTDYHGRKERKRPTSVTLEPTILTRIERVKEKMRGVNSRSGYINDVLDIALRDDEKRLGIVY